ncbi:MAG: A24 family peptidase [Planctomycetota bacterium]
MTWTVGILVTLLLLLLVATITDIRAQMIYNWNTYPGIVLGFVMRSAAGGMPALEDSVKGFFVCGVLIPVCCAHTGLGGGDLKLIAMMGAFLGFERGVEALLWTLVLGGIFGGVVIVWQTGFVNIVAQIARHLASVWQAGGWVPVPPAVRKPLKQTLFLAPAALVAVLIVTNDLWLNILSFAGTR